MRGEKEQECLDLVRKFIFTNDGRPIYHPFTGKMYLEVSDEEFIKEQIWFINSKCDKNYFGLLEEDRKEIEQILRNVQPNQNLNDFPDFIFERGFIEHFQVSSSKTTRKGAEHTKVMRCFTDKVNKEIEEIKREWNEIPSFDEVRSNHWAIQNPEHNHGYLVKSFERNWGNHLESLRKYTGNAEVGIFMIEYPEFALSMCENVYNDWIDGMSQGDMREQEKIRCYRLSRDKQLLDFMYQNKKYIKYVIFVYCDGFEIIRLENIPYLLKLLPWDYIIYPLMVNSISSLYNISIPENIEKKEKIENE